MAIVEIERRPILFHADTTMPDGSTLGYVGDPNDADSGGTEGEKLLYNSPAGTMFQDRTTAPYTLWQKVNGMVGGLWKQIVQDAPAPPDWGNIGGELADQEDLQLALDGKEPSIETKETAFNQAFETVPANIQMSGTASVGSSDNIPRADHIHPSDTSKVDVVSGKGLSTNDYTNDEKTKLGGLTQYTDGMADARVVAGITGKADDSAVVHKTGDETIAGVKTFSSFPVTPSSNPTTDYQAANKKYADTKLTKTANLSDVGDRLISLTNLTGTTTEGYVLTGDVNGSPVWAVSPAFSGVTADNNLTLDKLVVGAQTSTKKVKNPTTKTVPTVGTVPTVNVDNVCFLGYNDAPLLAFPANVTSNNHLRIKDPNAGEAGPGLVAEGGSTNIDIVLVPQGVGAVKVPNGYEFNIITSEHLPNVAYVASRYFPTNFTPQTSIDLNTFLTPGVHSIGNSGLTNKPPKYDSNVVYWILTVKMYDSSHYTQLLESADGDAGGACYRRTYYSGSWSSWESGAFVSKVLFDVGSISSGGTVTCGFGSYTKVISTFRYLLCVVYDTGSHSNAMLFPTAYMAINKSLEISKYDTRYLLFNTPSTTGSSIWSINYVGLAQSPHVVLIGIY